MVEEHLLGRREDGLRLLGCPRIQLVLGDEAQFFNKVLLSNSLLDELLQLFSDGDREGTQIGHRRYLVGRHTASYVEMKNEKKILFPSHVD